MAVQLRFIAYTVSAPEYDCSAHAPEEWTKLYGEPHPILGAWSIAFALVCQVCYVPCLRVFYRERRLTCYKVMWCLALADLSGLTADGTLFGYAMVHGLVFCSNPALGWLVGCSASFGWNVSTLTCAMLVLNRICEMLDRSHLFQGWRSSLCLLVAMVYGIINALFTRQVFPNSTHQTLAFDPFIPGHTYPNTPMMVHNMCVAFVVPCLYIILCTIIRKDSSRLSAVSSTIQSQQAKIFTQASIICCVNVFTSAAQEKRSIVITAGMITIQCVHGLPCIIYIVLNRAVRCEFRKMLGIRNKQISFQVSVTSAVAPTIIVPTTPFAP